MHVYNMHRESTVYTGCRSLTSDGEETFCFMVTAVMLSGLKDCHLLCPSISHISYK